MKMCLLDTQEPMRFVFVFLDVWMCSEDSIKLLE